MLVALTATDAERARSGALSREVLRAGTMGAAGLTCVAVLGVAVTDVLIEERLAARGLSFGGLAGLVDEVCVFGGDASVLPLLG